MIVYYSKMTGDELNRIYKVSGFKADDFAGKVGLNRNQLYTQFARRNKAIDDEIEAAVKGNPDLAKHQQLLSVGQTNGEKPPAGPTMEVWNKAMEIISETLSMLKKNNETIADDNRFIKEDAAVFRQVVQQGIKEGAISFNKPKK